MANTVIQLKHSTLTGNVPASLANGEISINNRDGKFFYSTPAGVVVTHYPYPGPAGLNQEIQFNDSGVLGTNSGLTFSKTTGYFTAPIIASSNNGNGTNFKVGDDIWIGDINLADTLRLTGQQNVNNAYIVFGASDAKKLGRSGTDALTYDGNFSSNGEISSLFSSGNEGGQVNLALAATNQSLSGSVAIDIYQNKFRIYETGGTNRGVFIDMANSAATSVGTDLLSPSSATDSWARGQANAAFIQANTPSHVANSAASYANAAFAVANSDTSAANTGAAYANSAFTAANSASLYANAGFAVANSGSIYANSGFSLANTANTTANSAQLYANSAFLAANNSAGTNLTQNTNITNAGTYANSAFLAANNSAGVNLTQNTNITNAGTYANSAFLKANTPIHTANSAALYANGAFTRANNSLNSNTGGTVTANTTFSGNVFLTGNGTTLSVTSNLSFISPNTQNTITARMVNGGTLSFSSNSGELFSITDSLTQGSIFSVNDISGLPIIDVDANGWISFAQFGGNVHVYNAATSVSNSTGALVVDGGVGIKGNVYADAVYDGGVEIIAYANSIFLAANTPSHIANSAASYANSAFLTANTPSATANSAASYANSGFAVANSAASYANSAFLSANNIAGVNLTQNNNISSAASYANSAFTRANNSLSANVGGTITGDVSITGNLTVTGNTTYTNTITVLIGDNIIVLNADLPQASQPTENAGIEIDRGAQPNSSFLWIETSGKWAANNGNTQIFVASEATLTSAFNHANSAFTAANGTAIFANTPSHVANSASSYANSAFSTANNSAGVNLTQNTNITAVSSYANSAFIHANAAFNTANTAGGATIGDVLALSIALG